MYNHTKNAHALYNDIYIYIFKCMYDSQKENLPFIIFSNITIYCIY